MYIQLVLVTFLQKPSCDDIAEAAGPLQVCAMQVAGCEAAIHAMQDLSCDDRAEAALLVDASNAFNTVNYQAALKNISTLCPALSMVLHITYGAATCLFATGQGKISLREGTSQGDPLAMVLLIRKLHSTVPDAFQVWFVDDATTVGPVSKLLEWWHHLVSVGPAFGYFPNSSKTFLLSIFHKLTHFLLILTSLLQCRAKNIWVQLLALGPLPRSMFQEK